MLTFYSPADQQAYLKDLVEWSTEQANTYKAMKPLQSKSVQKYLAYQTMADSARKIAAFTEFESR